MVKLEPKASALVAIGASTAANCTTCLRKTVRLAKENGADEDEIGVAVEIGKRVRAGAAVKTDPFALTSRYHGFELSRSFSFLLNQGSGRIGRR